MGAETSTSSSADSDSQADNQQQNVSTVGVFYFVGGGTSVDGMHSLQEFLVAMPQGSGLAFVIVQHRSPEFQRMMSEVLARHANMTVQRVEHTTALEPNSIYLTPPRKRLMVSQGRLVLSDEDVSGHSPNSPMGFVASQDADALRVDDNSHAGEADRPDGAVVTFVDISEPQRAEHALRRGEDRVREIIHVALDGVITMNDKGLITGWNPQAERIFGWTHEQAVGQSLAQLIIPASQRESHRRGLAKYLTTGVGRMLNQRLELIAIRKNGEEFPVELSVVPLRSDEQLEFCGYVRDLSERKRDERDRVRLAAIVQASHDAIIGKTIEGEITSWNAAAERIYGYTAEEAIGNSVAMLIPEERAGELAAIREKLERGDAIENFETLRRTKSGRTIDVALTVSPLRGPAGQVVGAATIARDITQRKRNELKLQLLRSVIEAISSSSDFESAMGNALELICRAIGWDYGEAWIPNEDGTALERSLSEFMSNEQLAPFARASSEWTLTNRESLPGRVWLSREPAWFLDVSSSGQRFLRSDAAASVGLKGGFAVPIVADGGVLAVLTFFMLSRPREADLALVIDLVNSVASQLGAVVQRKQIDAELRSALAELENKNREMEEFVYTVSHDLKSPLVTLGGMLGMLRDELRQGQIDDADEMIATAEDTVVGMGDTIADLLKLSRLGRVAGELEPLCLNELAREVIGTHAVRLEAHNVAVKLESDRVIVLADRNRLREVLDNIVSNALKYACDGPHARIEIGCVETDNEIRAFVRDEGPGIAEPDQEKAFGLFQRLSTTKEGTGVGLTIVRRIMEVHGGRAWIESKPGEGVTFWLAFPAPSGRLQ